MRKKLILGLLFAAMTAGAVKMKPGVTLVKQSDGTTIEVRAYGDEDLYYYLASDGTLLYHEGTDFFVASIAADGTLMPTKQLAHNPVARSVAEAELAMAQNRSLFFSTMAEQKSNNKIRREPVADDATLFPHAGTPKVAVILVEFSDKKFQLTDPKATFNKYLNGEDYFTQADDPEMGYTNSKGNFISNYGSVARYFNDMSFGQFKPQFDVYGPVTLSQPLKYYGGGSSSQENMRGLFNDACTAVDDDVDFSQYDSNNDGNVDLVYIIYAGYSESITGNSSDCIYPKSGTVTVSKAFDGKSIRRYGVNNELNFYPDYLNGKAVVNGIGLFCHEFSHCLGLPDMYAPSGSVAEKLINQTMDYWSLMDGGEYTRNGYRPTAYTAWEREAMGWMAIDTLNAAADIQMKSLADGGKAYRVINDNDATGHEYYVLENMQQTGWNAYLFGSGMMVTHVDYDENQFSVFGTKVNSVVGHPRMAVLAADGMMVPVYYQGQTITESSDATVKEINAKFVEKYNGQTFDASLFKADAAGDLFPGTANVTSLTDNSDPAKAVIYAGTALNKPITDIVCDTETGIVSFKFMGGAPDGITETVFSKDNNAQIYSVSGVYMGNDLNSLAKGIYIVGGKKLVKD